MAVLSIAAAGLALRTALIGSEAARFVSAALQESVELQRREQFLALVVDQDSRLHAAYAQIYTSRAEDIASLATVTDPGELADLQLQIKADGDLLRAAAPMFQVVGPSFDKGALVFNAAGVLDEQLATDPRLQELRSERSSVRADALHGVALTLVGDIALLVAALLLLTVAQVTGRRAAPVSSAVGLLLAICVMSFIAATDPSLALRLVLLICVVAFIPAALLIELAVVRGVKAEGGGGDRGPHPAATDTLSLARSLTENLPSSDPGIGDPAKLGTPFGRRVAVLLGMATLLAAIAGWLQASAFHKADVATGNAQAHAIAAAASLQRDVGAAEADIDRIARHMLARVSAANAHHAAAWYRQEGRTPDATARDRDAARWESLAASDSESATIAASEFGPRGYGLPSGGDPRFPNQYLLQAQHDALVHVGLADADNQTSAAWNGQGSAYTGVLAVLAVALYLLGLSLILQSEGLRRTFVSIACGAMGIAVVVGIVQNVWQPPDPSQASTRDQDAAEHFAIGDIAMSRAVSDPGRRDDYTRAVRELGEAIRLRPDFALAHQDLSTIHIQLGTRQTGLYPTVIDADACERSIVELRAAQRLGIDSALAPWNIGFCAYRQGLTRNDEALLDESVAQLGTALRLLPDQGILYANTGAAQLATGDVDGARRTYAAGIPAMVWVDAAKTHVRPPGERQAIVAAALSELDGIGKWRPELRAVAEELKQSIVVGTRPASTDAGLRVEDVELKAVGGLLQWTAHLVGADAAAATISIYWYRRDEQTQEWYVLPEISGDATMNSTAIPNFRRIGNADSTLHFGEVSFPGSFSPPRCLEGGRYRVELFVGDTVASKELDVADRDHVAEYDRLLGTAFCRPTEWTLRGDSPGRNVAYSTPDGRTGIVIIRAHVPTIDQAGLPAVVQEHLARAANLTPGSPVPAPQQGEVFGGKWFANTTRSEMVGIHGYMNVDAGRGLMSVTAVIDNYGSVVIVGVYGTAEGFQTVGEGLLAVADTVFFVR